MSAPITVEEVKKWLSGGRRHRCVICDGNPVKRISAITREGSGHRVVVNCHGEVANAIIPDSYVEAQSMTSAVKWFDNSKTRDQLSRIDRHGRIVSGENSWQDWTLAPYRQGKEQP